MSFSDWLQIVLSLIGVLVGVGISWVFFRAQQITDFSRLRDSILGLANHLQQSRQEYLQTTSIFKEAMLRFNENINRASERYELLEETMREVVEVMGRMKELTNVAELFKKEDDLSSIRATVESINNNLNNAVSSIIVEVREQQEGLLKDVQEKFDEQSGEVLHIIEVFLQRELNKIVPASQDRDVLMGRFVGLVEQAINRMGEFQRINFEQQSNSALATIEQKVTKAVEQVTQDVKDLKDKTDNLLALLPPKSDIDEMR